MGVSRNGRWTRDIELVRAVLSMQRTSMRVFGSRAPVTTSQTAIKHSIPPPFEENQLTLAGFCRKLSLVFRSHSDRCS
jgi:hypothetical protein